MKRPFALIGFTYLISLIIANFFSAKALQIAVLVFCALFVVSLFFKKLRREKTIPTVLLSITVALSLFSLYANFKVKPLEKLDEQDAFITGTVCELPYKSYNKYYYTVETEKIEIEGMSDVEQKVKTRFSVSKALNLDVYDKIHAKVHFFMKEDEKGFSSKNYFAAKGLHIFSYLYEYEDYWEEPGNARPLYYYCLKAKEAMCSSVRELITGNNNNVAQALLLGEQSGIDEETKSDFRDAGISHLLAVSGMHTVVIGYLLILVLMFFKVKKKWAHLLSCLGVLFFMGLTGFAASIVRAGIMFIIYNIGKFFKLEADSINSLGFATLLIALLNPASGGDIGLLLSICATLGIILLTDKLTVFIKSKLPKLEKVKNSVIINGLISSVCVTVSATVFTLPITMLYFQRVSLVCILANILVSFPSTVFIVLMLLAAILNFVPIFRFIVMPLVMASGFLLNYMTKVAQILASVNFASISTAHSFIVFWLAGTILLLALALFLGKGFHLIKIASLLSSILLFIGVLSYQVTMKDITRLIVADTGDGCSLVLKRNNNTAVISCGGDKIKYNKLRHVLDSMDINSLDYVVLSDFDDATAIYAQDLVNEYNPGHVVLPDRDDIDAKLSREVSDGNKAKYFNEKACIDMWGNANLEIVNTDEQGFMYLTVNDISVLICPSRVNAKYIPSQYRSCNFLIEGKIPENLDYISADYAVMANSSNVVNVNIQKVAGSEKVPLATAGMGPVAIDFLQGKEVMLRRLK